MPRFKKFFWIITLLSIHLIPQYSFSQTIPVGSLLDEQIKLQTLLSDSVILGSVNRPFSSNTYHSVVYNSSTNNSLWNRNLLNSEISLINGLKLGLFPTFLQNTLNSKIPYGENNQAAWYGRGNNTELMAGFYLTSKYLTVNFYPQIVYQENSDFLVPRYIPTDKNGNIIYEVQGIGNRIDAPFRFGPDPFTTFDPGNSSIRLHYKKVELGLSTESLWWGPAIRYPLVFSNNAAGIPHFFLNSREPITIPYLGDIQFQWMLGYPQESKYYQGEVEGQTRFINALNMAYSPSFLRNFTVGVTRVIHMYEQNGFDFQNVTIMFDPRQLSSSINAPEETVTQDRNQMISFYARLSLPEANAEIYGELFREDHSYDVRDFISQPHHNGAYSFGFQKISYLPWIDFIKTNLEFTNLTTSQLIQVRPQTYIYSHSEVRHGHTNKGQILGAAIGPGSNSQFLSIDAYKGNYKFGFFTQRWVDNDNFHFLRGSARLSPSEGFGDYYRHRVNLNVGVNFLYGPGPIYLNSKLMWTKAFNYGRFDYGEFEGINVRNYEHNDLINIQFQIGLTYIL